ncbi:transporter [Erythrobacter sp. WG]|uniref:transporter n=1 Tax=Erythrobacter sp. WG TaxID=2985510 RepID=UPI00226FCE81|nr:transporter [Erythrobacter sp. WG]MCX9148324.1 transporter [Erythrobacter sp. WG]
MQRLRLPATIMAASASLLAATPAFAGEDAASGPPGARTEGEAEAGIAGEDAMADKGGDRLRDLTTDRPDIAESPYTVDPGHIQIETTLIGYTRSRRDPAGVATDSYEFATSNLRIGLTDRLELDLVWQPYGIVDPRRGGAPARGIGSVTIRAKYNLWGNDGPSQPGDTALGLLPYVTLPTDADNGVSEREVSFGLIVPVALELGGGFALGMNAGANFTREDARDRFDASVLAVASLGFAWTERLGSYAEVAWEFSRGGPDGGDVVTLDTGLTFRIAENWQLDAGINVGVTRAADPIAPFIGFAARF